MHSLASFAFLSSMLLSALPVYAYKGNPIENPHGGNPPSQWVSPSTRLSAPHSVAHLVCFKFKAPTPRNPLILPALQALNERTGQPNTGEAPLALNTRTGEWSSGSSETPRKIKFTDLATLVRAVRGAYYAEAKQVPYLRAFSGGTNMSHEGTSNTSPNGFGLGYDLCFSGQFSNTNDRDFFVGDDTLPLRTDQHHHAFRNFVGGAIAGDASASPPFAGNLLVFDFQQTF